METQIKPYKFKKFIYLAVCSILGVLLFVFIVQLLLQLFSVLSGQDVSANTFELIVSVSNIVALCVGAWYGVWLGSYWYEKVYGTLGTGGFLSHVSQKFSAGYDAETEDSEASKVFKTTTWQMDDLLSMPNSQNAAKELLAEDDEPKKKVVVKRTRTVTKTKRVSSPKVKSTETKKPIVPVKRRATSPKRPVVN